MKRTHIILFAALLIASVSATAQDIPSRPMPPRLVNDFTATLSASQINKLEHKLVAYDDSTSTQIAVVMVNDLHGHPIADFAYQIGESWGVGREENSNGIVILVKPKNSTKGEAAISVGYGLEGVVTDAMSRRIIETLMVPEFKENHYYEGIDKAVDRIISIASGEYKNNADDVGAIISFVIGLAIVLMIVLILASGNNNRNFGSGGSSTDDFLKGMIIGSMFGRGGGSSSRGGFGGGGFGGFGGGHFGGGGASGSW